jgi:hypothetical protein
MTKHAGMEKCGVREATHVKISGSIHKIASADEPR